jgi:DNA-directed RNA polymerase alpha subunit
MADDQARIEDLPIRLSNPARRALAAAGIVTLADLARRTEREVLALHGVGPASMPTLRAALADVGLAFVGT